MYEIKAKPQPPAGLAPWTRELRFRWLTTARRFKPEEARAEIACYEERMNRTAWERYRSALAEWERLDPLPEQGK
jgi:hypothetical protein